MERLLKLLTEIPGPSGQEGFIKEAIARDVRPHCDRLWEDPSGNLIARTGPDSGYRLGILAHMDEVGLIVTRISDRGLIGFEMIGTIDVRLFPGREVDIIAQGWDVAPGRNRKLKPPSPDRRGSGGAGFDQTTLHRYRDRAPEKTS